MLSWTLDDIAMALDLDRPDEDGERAVAGLSTDTRTLRPGEVFVAVDGPNFRGRDFVEAAFERGAIAAVVVAGPAAGPEPSCGPLLEVPDGAAALLRLGAAIRDRLAIPVVGITGSVGKTSTKDALAALLGAKYRVVAARASFNNGIGVPLTLARVESSTEVAVLEIGTSEPGEIRRLTAMARPEVAVVTAIGAAHLEGLGSLEGVLEEKLSIREGLGEDGVLFLNADDPRLASRAAELGARTYGVTGEADVSAHDARVDDAGVAFRLSPGGPEIRSSLVGRHNLSNLLAAAAVARHLGMSEAEIAAAAPGVSAPRLRWEERLVPTDDGGRATLILDCYNANPASMRAALEAFADQAVRGRRWLVLGDMAELGEASEAEHRELLKSIERREALATTSVVFVGAAMTKAARNFRGRSETVATAAEVPSALQALGGLARDDRVLVKGSRSIALEGAFPLEEGVR